LLAEDDELPVVDVEIDGESSQTDPKLARSIAKRDVSKDRD